MKIANALKELRKDRNELNRLIKIRRENFLVLIPKNKTLKDEIQNGNVINFNELTSKINNILDKINNIREKILITNTKTKVIIQDEEMTLSKLFLLIGKYKSELNHFQNLGEERGLFRFDRRRITKTEEEEIEIPQLKDLQLEEKIKELEDKKTDLESTLEYYNATVDLIE